MSGGAWDYSQHVLSDIGTSSDLIARNRVLADMLTDMKKVIDAYDLWICGDANRDRAQDEWTRFCGKWKDTVAKYATEDGWLNCPFCGTEPKIYELDDRYHRYICECPECGCKLVDTSRTALKEMWNIANRRY